MDCVSSASADGQALPQITGFILSFSDLYHFLNDGALAMSFVSLMRAADISILFIIQPRFVYYTYWELHIYWMNDKKKKALLDQHLVRTQTPACWGAFPLVIFCDFFMYANSICENPCSLIYFIFLYLTVFLVCLSNLPDSGLSSPLKPLMVTRLCSRDWIWIHSANPNFSPLSAVYPWASSLNGFFGTTTGNKDSEMTCYR